MIPAAGNPCQLGFGVGVGEGCGLGSLMGTKRSSVLERDRASRSFRMAASDRSMKISASMMTISLGQFLQ